MPIRPFVASDREPLRAILQATGVFRKEEVEIAVELIDLASEEPTQTDYVLNSYADDDGTVRGYYCIGPTPGTASTYDLYWIAVDPGVQKSGIGTLLMKHCEELISSKGGKLIIVETSSLPQYTPTHRFYRRHKYESASRIRDYYGPGDDLMVFTKHL